MNIATPYYLIDERKLLRNMKIMQEVREHSGAKSLLALKCFFHLGSIRPDAAIYGWNHIQFIVRGSVGS